MAPVACVALFVAALREGWKSYLADAAPANAVMGRLNPEMDAEAFTLAAQAQQALIESPDGVGSMSAERWSQLAAQLKGLGLIDAPQSAESYFANVD